MKPITTAIKGWATGLLIVLAVSPFLLLSCAVVALLVRACWLALVFGWNTLPW